ncbi:MAG: hypothetical protein PF795_08395, partial [Kiritimatiellae bacterium]|jgi:hypothetical protein|nr:hypothetical protein [Kiritimatiellia bacterium]
VGDEDEDGQPNLHEYWAGTNPFDVDSLFKVLQPEVEGEDVTIRIQVVPGRSYRIQSSINLVDGDFEGESFVVGEGVGFHDFEDAGSSDTVKF